MDDVKILLSIGKSYTLDYPYSYSDGELKEILERFKKNIGDFGPSIDETNDYYIGFIRDALYILGDDDIEEEVLKDELGIVTIVMLAKALMKNIDFASDSTITLLRNKLSNASKGLRAIEKS